MSTIFSRKEQLKHVERNEAFWDNPIYQNDILYSIKNTCVYDFETSGINNTMSDELKTGTIVLSNQSTIATGIKAIQYPNVKVAILNFASYKHPGGGYKFGMIAQEESLCHQSPLYRILYSQDKQFYKVNRSNLNYGLYGDRVLYSPNVPFINQTVDDGSMYYKLDVITAACPNYRAAINHIQSRKISITDYKVALQKRCNAILEVAARNNVDHLILGAFGCGVFRNNPYLVAESFASSLNKSYRARFDCIEFAIPDATHNNKNYKAFESILKQYFRIIEINNF